MGDTLTNYWYIHKAEIGKLVGHEAVLAAGLDRLQCWTDADAARRREGLIYSQLADTFLERASVPSIGRRLFEGGADCVGLFTHYATWRCKGVTRYTRDERVPTGKQPPIIYTNVPAPEGDVRLELRINPEHLMSSSASSYLSGQVRLFVLAHAVSNDENSMIARPLAIASADYRFDASAARRAVRRVLFDHGQVRFPEIEAFEKAGEVEPPSPDQFAVMKDISEERTKQAFAEIIGEQFIDKDWPGERSDLFTPRLRFDGREISAAFAFKGPGKWKRMDIADMGKRGDQALRLFDEPADLVVVQHCHQIDSRVRDLMRALAAQYMGKKMFCLIDGADTWRILKAYGKCGIN